MSLDKYHPNQVQAANAYSRSRLRCWWDFGSKLKLRGHGETRDYWVERRCGGEFWTLSEVTSPEPHTNVSRPQASGSG
jgi:hypothetical protein